MPGHDVIAQAKRRRAAGDQAVDDRRGIGKAGGFDDDPRYLRHHPLQKGLMQLVKRGADIAGGRTADAARRRSEISFRTRSHQTVINGHRAEFIDDDRGIAHGRLSQKRVQQRRLARAQKTGQQGNRHRAERWRDGRIVPRIDRFLSLHSEHIRTFDIHKFAAP